MLKKVLLWVFVLCLLSSITSAETFPYTELFLHMKDVKTNTPIVNAPIKISIVNLEKGTTITSVKYMGADSMLDYKLTAGTWDIALRIDDPSTPETDYFVKETFIVKGTEEKIEQTLYLTPVGAVEGTVLDKSGDLVNNADIKFKCGIKSADYQEKTDRFGTFSSDVVPVGTCRISAGYRRTAGSEVIEVKKGETTETTIVLDRSLFFSFDSYFWVYVGIVIVAMALIAVPIIKKKRPVVVKKIIRRPKAKKKAAKKTKEEKTKIPPRAKDIMKTLRDVEKEVVDYLLKNKFKATQANIYHATGIPKTSLSRCIISLEAKNVVKVEKFGRMKKLKLTDWFLGKK